MAKFKFLAWNLRHFKGTEARLNQVDSFLTGLNPDIFGLIEYQGKSSIREFMVDRFHEYDFAVTDSTGNLEVVVGYRRGKFDQVVWTQKRTFNLDHVIAANEVEFEPAVDNQETIHVRGWRQLSGADKATFLWDISDHCAVCGEVK